MFTYLSLKTQNHIFFTIQHTQSRFENTNSIHAFVGDNDPGIQLPLYSFGKNNVLILANQILARPARISCFTNVGRVPSSQRNDVHTLDVISSLHALESYYIKG
jgi:hypothetical protein